MEQRRDQLCSELKMRRKREGTEKVRSKRLHGQFLMETDEKASEKSWTIVAKDRISEESDGRVFSDCPESVKHWESMLQRPRWLSHKRTYCVVCAVRKATWLSTS